MFKILRISLLYVFLLGTWIPPVKPCKSHHTVDVRAQAIGNSVEAASRKISHSLEKSSMQIREAIDTATGHLKTISKDLTNSLDKNVLQISKTVTDATNKLIRVGERLADSVDKGVEEISEVLKEAIAASKEIGEMLINSVDNAVAEIGKQINHAINTVREIVKDLTNSIDKGVEELGKTVRYMSDKILEVSKQISLRIDSGDLVQVANVTKQGLVASVEALTRNWNVAINTADLKDVGAAAAHELRQALNNINIGIKVGVAIDDNTKQAVLYIAIAVGIAFSVCFVAIVVSMKGCRKCCVQIFSKVAQRRSPQAEIQTKNDEEDVEPATLKKTNTSKPNRSKKGYSTKNTSSKRKNENSRAEISEDSGDSQSENETSKGFDKRQTLSLLDYDLSKVMRTWARRERRNQMAPAILYPD